MNPPRVRHAQVDAAHHDAHVEQSAFGVEARVPEVDLDATRGDAELSSLPGLRCDLELCARERDLYRHRAQDMPDGMSL